MSKFKITLEVEDTLSLGSILMTKGVTMIDIEKLNVNKQVLKQVSMPIKKRKPYKSFKHPSGMRIQDIVVELLTKTPNNTAKWAEIKKVIEDVGFGKSSINSALKRLTDDKILEKLGGGVYKLIKLDNK
jgi:hypothetical protein